MYNISLSFAVATTIGRSGFVGFATVADGIIVFDVVVIVVVVAAVAVVVVVVAVVDTVVFVVKTSILTDTRFSPIFRSIFIA